LEAWPRGNDELTLGEKTVLARIGVKGPTKKTSGATPNPSKKKTTTTPKPSPGEEKEISSNEKEG